MRRIGEPSRRRRRAYRRDPEGRFPAPARGVGPLARCPASPCAALLAHGRGTPAPPPLGSILPLSLLASPLVGQTPSAPVPPQHNEPPTALLTHAMGSPSDGESV